ncbi:phage holin family protein [Nitratidesulfovibrio liaohensis]|uniref:Phage holin family protein n=1 Tax=Nitratidesulfovibrio liaohensis TaxID=2604158 RepID=A0ABY9QZQ0_9BACT|nr:phage holin family protein [Nitratidesulfovibrio liaohensis]WMW64402.1 phage holin family protein [Nitratidesulfovibrio liaohensis]
MHDEIAGSIGRLLESLGDGMQFKSGWALVFGVIGAALGGVWPLVILLVLLLTVDFALGFARASRTGGWKSSKFAAGWMKYVFYVLAVFVMALAEEAIAQSAPFRIPVRDLFVGYLCVNEALSCLEHLSFFGVPVPASIRERLREYRDTLCAPTHQPQDRR